MNFCLFFFFGLKLNIFRDQFSVSFLCLNVGLVGNPLDQGCSLIRKELSD